MTQALAGNFSCQGCLRTFVWKDQLAGRKVKCKCGETICVPKSVVAAVPAAPKRPAVAAGPVRPKPIAAPPPKAESKKVKPAEPEMDDLYALAADADSAAAAMPVEVLNTPLAAPVIDVPVRKTGSAVPLAYRRAPTAREKAYAGNAALIDMNRDVYVPTALMVVGLITYVAYYAFRYDLGTTGIAAVSIGVSLLTVFKTALLIGFALVVAGPLGVSFGGVWTAILKLAAMAIFCDGCMTWIEGLVEKFSGGFGGHLISFPISAAVYWGLLTYLFSMDPGDSWLVVIVLRIFERILFFALVLVLAMMIPSLASMSGGGSTGAASAGSGTNSANSTMTQMVNQAKDEKRLVEARQYIADGHQSGMKDTVDAWYMLGCRNVWYETTGGDINGRRMAANIVVELPTNKAARTKFYESLAAYYKGQKIDVDPEDLKDTGERYATVEFR